MKKKMYDLFPVSVMKFKLQDEYEHWDTVKEDLYYASTCDGGITEGNVQTSFIDDWRAKTRTLPLFQELDSLMLSCLSQYCFTMSIETLEILDSWYTIMHKGSRVLRHRHEGSVVSGTLFVKMPEGSHGLAFTNPTIPYRMYEKTNQSNPSNEYAHLMDVEEGDLLLYPSWMEHFVPPIDCDDRITISFNTDYPVGGVYNVG